jgi:RNA polymerase sigma-70 factor (ECF subfamily)
MSELTAVGEDTRESFHRLLVELRPRLHRYSARVTGSVIDGEDVVQEALVKAIEAFERAHPLTNPEAWLFRIAHNTALDFLRRRTLHEASNSNEDVEMMADTANVNRDPQITATSLGTFMQLPVAQRSSVILMDVLGYSLREIGTIMDTSIPAVKAALHRGRARLRQLGDQPAGRPLPVLSPQHRSLLAAYVDRFNERDFDAIRNMLADEVRLDLVARVRMKGRTQVGTYLHNYSQTNDWHFALGAVEGRPAVLVSDPRNESAVPLYFVLLDWNGDKLRHIRDFRYARYAIEGAEFTTQI